LTTRARITVVVPVYNYAHYLTECLASVVAQTRQDWVAIVVDDASTVGDAAAVVAAFADPRMTLLRHTQNRGLAAARNTGIRHAESKYVLPLDSDDKLAPTYLAEVFDAFDADDTLNAVFTDFLEFGSRGNRLRLGKRDVKALLREQWIPGPGTSFTRSLWEAIGGYCEAEALRVGNEDWDFWVGAASYGLSVIHVPQPLYLYRQHGESMMQRLHYYEPQTRAFVYQRHRALFDRYGMRGVFLSRGYLSSAKAHWRNRERMQALWLGLRSFVLAPVDCVRCVSEQTGRWLERQRMTRRIREAA
jgi:glycosyltransferase involved in cell wall biosynthesis